MESHCCGPGPPNCSIEAHRKSLLWPWPPVKAALKASRKSLLWIWGACWGRCLEGLAGLGGFGAFGGFGGFGEFWRVLEGLRAGKRQLWKPKKAIAVAWPWGACWGSCLGPRILCRLANCSFEAHRKSLLWPWPPVKAALKASRKSLLWIWGACWGRCLEGLAGLGGFGAFGGFGGFGEFWRVLEGLRAGKRQLWKPKKAIAVAWPWGACWGSCLGPRVHVGEGVWNFGSLDPLQAGKRQLWGP